MRRMLMLCLSVLMVGVAGAGAVTFDAGVASAKGLTTKNPFRVFSPEDRTGPTASIGKYWSSGLDAGVKYVNAHGGILGHKVVVTYTDTHSVAQTATTITTSALASGKYQMVVPTTSSSTAVLQVTNRFKTLEIGAGGGATTGNGVKYPYSFSMNPTQPSQATPLACLVEQTYHPKKVAYLWVNDTTFISSKPGYVPVWKKYGVKVVADEPFTFAATTISPQVEKIMSADPTVLIVAAYFGSLSVAIKGLNGLNYTVPVAGNTETTADSPSSFLSATTKYPKTNVGIQWTINSRINGKLSQQQKIAGKALATAVKGTYPVVLATYLYTYDALLDAKWAAAKANSTTGKKMAKALETLGANPSVKTGSLSVTNPLFTTKTHWLHTGYYNVNVLGSFTTGTFPTKGTGKPIPNCLKK